MCQCMYSRAKVRQIYLALVASGRIACVRQMRAQRLGMQDQSEFYDREARGWAELAVLMVEIHPELAALTGRSS